MFVFLNISDFTFGVTVEPGAGNAHRDADTAWINGGRQPETQAAAQ